MSDAVIEVLVREVAALRQRVAALETHDRSPIGCLAYRATAFTVPNASNTVVGLDAEVFDFGNLHDTTTNNSRITVPMSGLYLAVAGVNWAAGNSGDRLLGINQNGSEPTPIARSRFVSSGPTDQVCTRLLRLAAGDYLELWVYQSSGAGLGFEFTTLGGAWLGVVYLGRW